MAKTEPYNDPDDRCPVCYDIGYDRDSAWSCSYCLLDEPAPPCSEAERRRQIDVARRGRPESFLRLIGVA